MSDKMIYFVRHGETEYNRKFIVQGSGVDSDLNDKGQKQAQAFFDFYKNEAFDLLVTSTLKRTHQTMKAFIDSNLTWVKTADINEICWGVHEGKTGNATMKQAYQNLIAAWSVGNFDASLEEGESARELSDRIGQFLAWIKVQPQSKILVCTHGRALRCIIAMIKEQHLREMENVSHHNTGLYKVAVANGRFEVVLENDIRHLDN